MRDKFKKVITISTIVLVSTLIVGYSYYISRNILFGPQITINSPLDGNTLDDHFIELNGSVINAVEVVVNGNKIFMDAAGNFSEKMLLSYGYNIIEVKARDRFNRTSSKNLNLLLK